MDLSLNETQLMLRDMVRDFVEREVPKSRVREIDESPTGFSPDLWKQMAERGWPGMAVSEEYGGTANSLTDLAVVFESLGEAACPSPLLSNVLCAFVIDAAKIAHPTPAVAQGFLGLGRLVPIPVEQPGVPHPDFADLAGRDGIARTIP